MWSREGSSPAEEYAEDCRDDRGDQRAVGAEEHHGGHPGQGGAVGGQSPARRQWRSGPSGAVGEPRAPMGNVMFSCFQDLRHQGQSEDTSATRAGT